MSSSGIIIVAVLQPVPLPKCASSNSKARQTSHIYICEDVCGSPRMQPKNTERGMICLSHLTSTVCDITTRKHWSIFKIVLVPFVRQSIYHKPCLVYGI